MNLSGNTALVTGGAVGIGFALSRALLRAGNRVLICGRRAQRLEEARAEHPSLETLTCDVSTPGGRHELVEWSTRIAPDLNMLFNNAGIQNRVDLLQGGSREGRYDEIAINLEAPIHLCELFIPHLARQSSAAIVNVTSGLAFTPLAATPIYSATKAALHSFSLSLRHQLRKTSIRVFEIAPPLVQSELHNHQNAGITSSMGMPTDEFAAECLRGIEHDEYTNAVGPAAKFQAQREAMFATLNPQ
jgi:uncharacterized oxidoreductase